MTSSGDQLCAACGRPVVGSAVWGQSGPYHPECTRGPGYRQEPLIGPAWTIWPPPPDPRIPDLERRIADLERRLGEKEAGGE